MSSVGGTGHTGHTAGAHSVDATDEPVAVAPTHSAHRAGHGSTTSAERVHVRMTSRPATARAGHPVGLTFDITGTDGRPARLATVHEKKAHTIVVSDDLAEFAHIHPDAQRGGKYTVDYTPGRSGAHTVFVELTPSGSGAKTELKQFPLAVGGPASTSVPLSPDLRAKVVGSTKVSLKPVPRTIRAGQPVTLSFDLKDARTGAPAAGMQPYLGAAGHAIAISGDRRSFVHAHPVGNAGHGGHGGHGTSGAAGKVQFEATFPKAGLYKVWGQFLRNGQSVVAPFVVRVQP